MWRGAPSFGWPGSGGRVARLVAIAVLEGLASTEAVVAEPRQDLPYLRVRLGADGERVEGQLIDDDSESLMLQREYRVDKPTFLRIPRRDIRLLEVRERPSRKGKGALIGAGVGVAFAAVVGLTSRGDTEASGCSPVCFSKAELAVFTGLLAVPAGTLIGFAVAPGTHWSRVLSPERFTGRAPPRSAGALTAAIVVRF